MSEGSLHSKSLLCWWRSNIASLKIEIFGNLLICYQLLMNKWLQLWNHSSFLSMSSLSPSRSELMERIYGIDIPDSFFLCTSDSFFIFTSLMFKFRSRLGSFLSLSFLCFTSLAIEDCPLFLRGESSVIFSSNSELSNIFNSLGSNLSRIRSLTWSPWPAYFFRTFT